VQLSVIKNQALGPETAKIRDTNPNTDPKELIYAYRIFLVRIEGGTKKDDREKNGVGGGDIDPHHGGGGEQPDLHP
jgi:hypothetical protein